MSVHVQTGHKLDVVYSVSSEGRQHLQGIQPHGGILLPLYEKQAQALIDVLQRILNEITEQETANGKKSTD
ncbi:MAG TPA: hypothetical protein VL866_24475 [Pyrinomonadaceae bacterium]|nr:hypothetical protein [Pyrinomonadaceae bacterium]